VMTSFICRFSIVTSWLGFMLYSPGNGTFFSGLTKVRVYNSTGRCVNSFGLNSFGDTPAKTSRGCGVPPLFGDRPRACEPAAQAGRRDRHGERKRENAR